MTLLELEFAWNSKADTYNQWNELSLEEKIEFAQTKEQERCIGHIIGQCGSDNVAQRTLKAIRSGK